MNREAASRTIGLIGQSGLERLAAAHVTVCGVGGVGSYAVEALARSGIGALTLIDFDVFAESNMNRQISALISTMKKSKVHICAERVAEINPLCRVEVKRVKLSAANLADTIPDCDYLIDAIDDLPAKTALIKYCLEHAIPIVSSMGTGNKLAPELLEVGDISQTHSCALARALRKNLREQGIEKGVKVVFSPEGAPENEEFKKERTPASMVFVPGAAGLILASLAVRDLIDAK